MRKRACAQANDKCGLSQKMSMSANKEKNAGNLPYCITRYLTPWIWNVLFSLDQTAKTSDWEVAHVPKVLENNEMPIVCTFEK